MPGGAGASVRAGGRLLPLLLVIPFLGFPVSAPAVGIFSTDRVSLDLEGYFKDFFLAERLYPLADGSQGSEFSHVTWQGANLGRFRIKLFLGLPASVDLELHWELRPRTVSHDPFSQSTFGFGSPVEGHPFRVADFSPTLAGGGPAESFRFIHDLDRLSATFPVGLVTVKIGRQAISWGSGRFVNPTDLISPWSYLDIDQEEKRGVDAVRLTASVGQLSEVDLLWVAGPDFHPAESAVALRIRTHLMDTDLVLSGQVIDEDLMLGLDLARDLGPVGWWVESAWTLESALAAGPAGDSFVRVVTGIERKLQAGPILSLEYHYSGFGSSDPDGYLETAARPAFRRGQIFYLGRHYLAPAAQLQATSYLSLRGGVLVNLGDGSFLLNPEFEYSVTDDLLFKVGSYLSFGASPVFAAGSEPPGIKTEFGAIPDTFYLAFYAYY